MADKFCSNCMKLRPEEGGTMVRTKNNRVRWRCSLCTQRVKAHEEILRNQGVPSES